MSHARARSRRFRWLHAAPRGLRWLLRQFTGSASGAAHLEHVFVAGACAFCALGAFKHYGAALEAHERLQAVHIDSPERPSAEEYASSLGVGVDPESEPDDEAEPGKPIHPRCFKRRSSKGLEGFEPRRVYDEDEVRDDPRFERFEDEQGRYYWLPKPDLQREMMRKEEDRQLAAQQTELNRMTVDEYLQNRQQWKDRLDARREAWKAAGKKGSRPNGRPSTDGRALDAERSGVIDALFDHYMMEALAGIHDPTAAQIEKAAAAAHQAIEKDIGGTNPLHKLDGSAGGDGTMHGLGNGAVNQYIGSQWPSRTRAVEKEATAMQDEGLGSRLMNVELRHCD